MAVVLKTDIDAVVAIFQAQGKMHLSQAAGQVAVALGYSSPEFPRAVRDLVAQLAGTGRDYPDWSALTKAQIVAAVQAARTLAS